MKKIQKMLLLIVASFMMLTSVSAAETLQSKIDAGEKTIVLDKNYNEECDLWSLGVIMYVMLRGNYPFKGNDIESTFKLIKEGKYVLDSYPFNNISDDAKDLIKRLLIIDPTMRIPACDALNHPFFIKNRVKEKLSYLSTEDIQTMLKNVMKYMVSDICRV